MIRITLKGISEQTLSRGYLLVELSLARLFNSHWHSSSTVTGTIVQQWLAWFFNSHWHDCSTVTGTIIQQLLARFFNCHWHDSSIVAGTILQLSLARFFNSGWYNSSIAMVKIFLFSLLAELFNSDVHCWRIVPCTRNTTHDPITAYPLIN